jgi:hypothetical protein
MGSVLQMSVFHYNILYVVTFCVTYEDVKIVYKKNIIAFWC